MVPAARRREAGQNASQCVGAQYVATLDPEVPGCLVELPKVGSPMLFARVDGNGRVSLVRTGNVVAFEMKQAEEQLDPFRESVGVLTSAPAADELRTTRKTRRAAHDVAPPHAVPPPPATEPDLGVRRTQPLRTATHAASHAGPQAPSSPAPAVNDPYADSYDDRTRPAFVARVATRSRRGGRDG